MNGPMLGRSMPPPPGGPNNGVPQLTLDVVAQQVNAGDPEGFYQQAQAFDKVANDLQDTVDQFRGFARGVRGGWSGDTAEAAQAYMDSVAAQAVRLLATMSHPNYGDLLRQAGDALANSQRQLALLLAARTQRPTDRTQYDYQARIILNDLSETYVIVGNQLAEMPGLTNLPGQAPPPPHMTGIPYQAPASGGQSTSDTGPGAAGPVGSGPWMVPGGSEVTPGGWMPGAGWSPGPEQSIDQPARLTSHVTPYPAATTPDAGLAGLGGGWYPDRPTPANAGGVIGRRPAGTGPSDAEPDDTAPSSLGRSNSGGSRQRREHKATKPGHHVSAGSGNRHPAGSTASTVDSPESGTRQPTVGGPSGGAAQMYGMLPASTAPAAYQSPQVSTTSSAVSPTGQSVPTPNAGTAAVPALGSATVPMTGSTTATSAGSTPSLPGAPANPASGSGESISANTGPTGRGPTPPPAQGIPAAAQAAGLGNPHTGAAGLGDVPNPQVQSPTEIAASHGLLSPSATPDTPQSAADSATLASANATTSGTGVPMTPMTGGLAPGLTDAPRQHVVPLAAEPGAWGPADGLPAVLGRALPQPNDLEPDESADNPRETR